MQKTAYEMRISDWSSDVCSSGLGAAFLLGGGIEDRGRQRCHAQRHTDTDDGESGKESGPVARLLARESEQRIARRRDRRADDQRQPRAVSFNKSARPARSETQDRGERQEGRAGRRGAVAMDLDEKIGRAHV